MDIPVPKFSGMNNRDGNEFLPTNKLRNAVNIDFGKNGEITTRVGLTKRYSGSGCHSFYQYVHEFGKGLFVEGGVLKRFNTDNTATNLATVGNGSMSYLNVDDSIYLTNGEYDGIYRNGVIHPWGIEPPFVQPQATATQNGGLYAGTYQVAITWLYEFSPGKFQESSTWEARFVDVPEGGGILLDSFPPVPSGVTKMGVYVSGLNGDDLYRYGYFPTDNSSVQIGYKVSNVKLRTQFMEKIRPKEGLEIHQGRILWIDGKRVHYTPTHAFGLYIPNNYWPFNDEVTNIISIQTALYVTTTKKFYKMEPSENGTRISEIRNFGAGKGNFCKDVTNSIAYVTSYNAIVALTPQGATDIGDKDMALPYFRRGSMAIVQGKGDTRLVSISQGYERSESQHSDYTTIETARGASAAWV